MRRRVATVLSVLPLLFIGTLLAQESRDPVPLNDWPVPFEQIRAKVMETEPGRIAERSLHPSVNAVPSAASHFITVVPCRVVDTRLANGTYGGPKLVGGTSRSFAIPAGPCAGLPVAAAYSLNLTVTQPEADNGFLKAYPTGSAQPLVSSLNFNTNDTKGNAAIVPANGTGSFDIFTNVNTHLIVDINGYFVEGVVTNLNPGIGMMGGGTGNVTLGLAPGGVTSTQLAGNSVSTGALQDNAVTGAKIASGQVVKSINSTGVDAVTIQGGGTATVNTTGSTITITAAAGVSGSIILGTANDTNLISAGYTEIGDSGQQIWRATSTSSAPSARRFPTSVWTGTKMIVWGGVLDSSGTVTNTGAQYDPATNSWVPTSTTSPAPSARWLHTAVWTGSRMIVWGGFGASAALNSGGRYDPATDSWTATTIANAPAVRYFATAVWTGTKMIVWGGYDGTNFLNTGGRYDPVGDTWTATSLSFVPTPRYYHTAVWADTRMIVWGGEDNTSSYVNTGGVYYPATDVWSPMSTNLAPAGRGFHTAVWSGTAMIVWGGYNGGSGFNTGGLYDPATNIWTSTAFADAPSGRLYHTAVWTGSRMIVWGGGGSGSIGGEGNTGGTYNPLLDSWAPTSLAGVPSGRGQHTAVWTGTTMIVWGGITFDPVGFNYILFNTGGVATPLSYYKKN